MRSAMVKNCLHSSAQSSSLYFAGGVRQSRAAPTFQLPFKKLSTFTHFWSFITTANKKAGPKLIDFTVKYYFWISIGSVSCHLLVALQNALKPGTSQATFVKPIRPVSRLHDSTKKKPLATSSISTHSAFRRYSFFVFHTRLFAPPA